MGMFTTVKDGERSWQFKCGYDQCEAYNVGDTVLQEIEPSQPGEGKLLDAVHDGYPCGDYPPVWVAIKDGIISIHAMANGGYPIEAFEESALRKKLGILPPDPSMWSDEVWAIIAKREYLRKCEKDLEDAENFGLTQEELATKCSTAFIRNELRRPSFARLIMGLDTLPPSNFEYYHSQLETRKYSGTQQPSSLPV